MIWLNGKFRRASASLCAALMIVFALAASASAVNRLQHVAGGTLPHQHALFSEILLEDHHDADHHHDTDHHHEKVVAGGHQPAQGGDHHDADLTAGQDDTAQAQGQQPHHHGDTGASMMVLNILPSGLIQPSEHWRSPAYARFKISVRQWLPERPPRTAPSTI